MTLTGVGELLMNGDTVHWPPQDVDGQHVNIGDEVYSWRDTLNGQRYHRMIVGSLRLQYQSGTLAWVVCAYEDDGSGYFECWSDDCKVLRHAPMI